MGAMLTMRSQMENVRTMGKEIAREAYDFADVMLAEADMRNMSEDEARDDDGDDAAARIDEITSVLRVAHHQLNEVAAELYRTATCGKPCCGDEPCERHLGHGPSSSDNAGHECARCVVPF